MDNKKKNFGKPLYALHIEAFEEFDGNFVIHTGAYFTNCLIDKKKNIYGNHYVFFNMKYDCIELLLECVNFGKNLYDIFDGNFFIDFKTKKFYTNCTIMDDEHLESTPIEIKLNDVQKLFINWFNIVGCPAKKNAFSKTDKIYVTLPILEDLRNKYIILYLMYTILSKINIVIDMITNYNINLDGEDKKKKKLQNLIKDLEYSLKIFKFQQFNFNYNSLKELLQNLYNLKIFFLYRLQQFSDCFKIQLTPYIVSFEDKTLNNNIPLIKTKIINTSENLFDLAWNILINLSIDNHKFNDIRMCKCGILFIPTNQKNIFCPKCKEINIKERSINQRNERKNLITEICSYKETRIMTDKISKMYLNEILDLTTTRYEYPKGFLFYPYLTKL